MRSGAIALGGGPRGDAARNSTFGFQEGRVTDSETIRRGVRR